MAHRSHSEWSHFVIPARRSVKNISLYVFFTALPALSLTYYEIYLTWQRLLYAHIKEDLSYFIVNSLEVSHMYVNYFEVSSLTLAALI